MIYSFCPFLCRARLQLLVFVPKLFESGEVNAEVPEGFALVSRSSVTGKKAEGVG